MNRRLLMLVPPMALIACFMVGCREAPREFSTEGTVWHFPHIYAESLMSVSSQLGSIDLRSFSPNEDFNLDAAHEGSVGETIAVWGERDARWKARQGSGIWLDLGRAIEGSIFEKRLESLSIDRLSEGEGAGYYFIPTHLSFFGVIRNQSIMPGSPAVPSWDDFVQGLADLRTRGVYPFAVGGAFASPSLAILALLDLRLNGNKEYIAFVNRQRSIEESSFDSVFALLQTWKDLDYFHPESYRWSSTDALSSVESGSSAMTILSGSAASRMSSNTVVGFSPFPATNGEPPKGEIARSYGYSIVGSRANLESALAFVEGVFNSALLLPNETLDAISALAGGSDLTFPNQLPFVENEKIFLPSFESLLDSQVVHDIGTVFTRFWREDTYDSEQLREQIDRFLNRGTTE